MLIVASSCSSARTALGRITGSGEDVTPLRVAILPIENLTSDTSLDWITSTASLILIEQTRGVHPAVIVSVPALRDAYANNAARVMHGYFTRPPSGTNSGLQYTLEIEDLSSHKIVETIAAQGNILQAMDRAAHSLTSMTRAFSTSNPDAVAAWGSGNFERAVELDSDFGTAWAARVRQLAIAGKPAEAEEAATRALARSSLRSDYNRFEIGALLAELRSDYRGRAQALEGMVALFPFDVGLLKAAAEAHSVARNFDAAAKLYRAVIAIDPRDAQAMNSLGYTEALAGRLDDAKRTFEGYAKQPGQATNALDSLGEAFFLEGRFKEAESYFEQAYARDPKFLDGKTHLKAAYARWLAGDLPAADRIFEDYAAKRTAPLVTLERAAWLYSTDRQELATAQLSAVPPELKPLADRQLAAWRAAAASRSRVPSPQELAKLKSAFEASVPPADAEARTAYAAALVAAGRPDEASPLVKQWPLPTVDADPFAGSQVYPTFRAVRQTLKINQQ